MVNFINMDIKYLNLFKFIDCNIIVCFRIKIKV